jgi:serine/threonine protein kinase
LLGENPSWFVVPNNHFSGTPLYMAPEILFGRKFNEKCDVYSFGIILWQMLTRKDPFTHHNDLKGED